MDSNQICYADAKRTTKLEIVANNTIISGEQNSGFCLFVFSDYMYDG